MNRVNAINVSQVVLAIMYSALNRQVVRTFQHTDNSVNH